MFFKATPMFVNQIWAHQTFASLLWFKTSQRAASKVDIFQILINGWFTGRNVSHHHECSSFESPPCSRSLNDILLFTSPQILRQLVQVIMNIGKMTENANKQKSNKDTNVIR